MKNIIYQATLFETKIFNGLCVIYALSVDFFLQSWKHKKTWLFPNVRIVLGILKGCTKTNGLIITEKHVNQRLAEQKTRAMSARV